MSTKVQALSTACQLTSQELIRRAQQEPSTSRTPSSLLSIGYSLWNSVLSTQLEHLRRMGGSSRPVSESGAVGRQGQHPRPAPTPSKVTRPPRDPASTTSMVVNLLDKAAAERELKDIITSGKQMFPRIKTNCGTSSCNKCLSLFTTIPISPCAAHGGVVCNASKWHPHLTQGMWQRIARIHNSDREWSWTAPTPREGQHINPLLATSTQEVEAGVLTLRVSAEDMDGIVSDAASNSEDTQPLPLDNPSDWSESAEINRPLSPTYQVGERPISVDETLTSGRKRRLAQPKTIKSKGKKKPT